ncbi:MAG TPA: HAD-IC family P-type ATPase, partial [Pirellulaceae bacterium]|nr:HAD-IC family P-type ATPase [Pirellulaceae bacterium]
MTNSDLPATWNCPTDVVLARSASSTETGLSAEAIERLRAQHGFNELAEAPGEPAWKRLVAQFAELVIGILVAAAVISGLMGEWLDAVAILAIVVLNGLLGFFQEERAERALAALQKLSSPMAKVLRDGRLENVPARELVPGDIVELEAGDYVPADVRLLRAYGVAVQEAALTGESVPVEKDADVVLPTETPLADRRNQAYFGTVVAAGKATAVVVATGMVTELGRIAGLLQREPREPTPLQRRLAELGRLLISLCLAVVLLVFLLQWFRGGAFLEALLIAVSLAVAAVPEGLPAVVTISLALGLQRMVRRNALVRKLPSVETLGSVSVVCSDKTGTLTRNEMTVRRIVVDDCEIEVTGGGYAPRGEFVGRTSSTVAPGTGSEPGPDSEDRRSPVDGVSERASTVLLQRRDLKRLLTVAAWCNNARLTPPSDGGESWRVIGDPTEGALLVVAMKADIVAAARDKRVLFELPFDSTRKAMSVVVASDAASDDAVGGDSMGARGVREVYTKGAPEVVLAKCVAERRGERIVPLTDERRRWWLEVNSRMASEALRVLALAERSLPSGVTPAPDEVERELVLTGLVGMIDPPRDEARVAVATCRSAGIRPVMITGDHPATALAIARELKLAGPDDGVMTGAELDTLTDEQLAGRVEHVAVYARVSAEHKLRVVRAWKSRNQ